MEDKLRTEDLLEITPLDKDTTDLANQIINESDIDKVKNLTALFNLNQAKKNVLRVMKYNSLLDAISDQMTERIEQRPGEFSNNTSSNLTLNALSKKVYCICHKGYLTYYPNSFKVFSSNNDLLNYMNVVQSSIDRANKSIELVDSTPAIQLNQVNINLPKSDVDLLDSESRERVLEVLQAIKNKMNKVEEVKEAVIIEPEEPEEKINVSLIDEQKEDNLDDERRDNTN